MCVCLLVVLLFDVCCCVLVLCHCCFVAMLIGCLFACVFVRKRVWLFGVVYVFACLFVGWCVVFCVIVCCVVVVPVCCVAALSCCWCVALLRRCGAALLVY